VRRARDLLGTIGRDRLDCGVIGDPVNIAARIDGMTKVYGAPLLVSEGAFAALERKDAWMFREVDRAIPAGCTQPVTVFEPLEGDAAPKRATAGLFGEGLSLYRAAAFDRAVERFRACARAIPEDSAARVYIERCEELLERGAPPGWDGVTTLSTK
jgi:hypothetical protein